MIFPVSSISCDGFTSMRSSLWEVSIQFDLEPLAGLPIWLLWGRVRTKSVFQISDESGGLPVIAKIRIAVHEWSPVGAHKISFFKRIFVIKSLFVIALIMVNVAHPRYEPSALEIFLSLRDVGLALHDAGLALHSPGLKVHERGLAPVNKHHRYRDNDTHATSDGACCSLIVVSELPRAISSNTKPMVSHYE